MPGSRNQDVARLFHSIADLLEIKGELPFKIAAYRRAAERVEALPEPIERVQSEGRLRQVQGIGPAIEQKISEYLQTGKLGFYDKLTADYPPTLAELLQVPGLGPRTARQLHASLGISRLADLQAASAEGRLKDLPGLGAKTEANIRQELERLTQRTNRYQLAVALELADDLLATLRERLGPDVELAYAGSLRRMRDTIGDIDLLASTAGDTQRVVDAFLDLPHVREVLRSGPVRAGILGPRGMQDDLRVVEPRAWGAALVYFTGSKEHNIRLRELAVARGWKLNEYGLFDERTDKFLAGESEEQVYEALGLQYVPPELREDDGEIEAARTGSLPHLIELTDLKGDLHVHSDWSDGRDTLEQMARAARALGHQYFAITDHSKSLGVARGLTEARVAEQRLVIERLNRELAPFRILHGTEMDILRDGRLDYVDDVLAAYDYVSASVHSAMRQSESEMTARIQAAISNPWVNTLNHPFGRLIPNRPAYDVDMAAVIQTAGQHGVAMEVNSQPERMDLDAVWARHAAQAGVRLVINTDSHLASQLSMLRLGIATARRAWLEPRNVLNALDLADLETALQRPRR
jgi:DNA polymerase (family 10)